MVVFKDFTYFSSAQKFLSPKLHDGPSYFSCSSYCAQVMNKNLPVNFKSQASKRILPLKVCSISIHNIFYSAKSQGVTRVEHLQNQLRLRLTNQVNQLIYSLLQRTALFLGVLCFFLLARHLDYQLIIEIPKLNFEFLSC